MEFMSLSSSQYCFSLCYQETSLNLPFSLPVRIYGGSELSILGSVQGEEGLTEDSRNTMSFKALM